jgi:hypothetical protein
MSEVTETVETTETEAVAEVNTTPANPYKKTNRVRKAKLHETLETNLRTTERALTKAGATDVSIVVERNNDPSAVRYARAIFDATFTANGRSIPVRGKTAEEILAVARGIRLALDLQRAE